MQLQSTTPDGAGYRSAVDLLAQLVEEAYRRDPTGNRDEGRRLERAEVSPA